MRQRPAGGRVVLCGILALALIAACSGRATSDTNTASVTATVDDTEEGAAGDGNTSRTVEPVPSAVGSTSTTAGGRANSDSTTEEASTKTVDAGSEILPDGSIVCWPGGEGPFPAVLYNHGGKRAAVGGDLEATCEALADAGYIARSEKRPESITLTGHLDDVLQALTALRARHDVDPDRVGIMGFSRGGLLTLQAAWPAPTRYGSWCYWRLPRVTTASPSRSSTYRRWRRPFMSTWHRTT